MAASSSAEWCFPVIPEGDRGKGEEEMGKRDITITCMPLTFEQLLFPLLPCRAKVIVVKASVK